MKDNVINRVYMLTPEMEPVSGVAASLTTLTIELARRGIDVWIFALWPIPRSSQYVRRLRAHQVHIISPPLPLRFLLRVDWHVRNRILGIVVRVLLPFFLPLILLDSIQKRRSLSRSWQGMSGFLNGVLSRYILPDYLSRIYYRQLNKHARNHPPDVVEVSGSDFLQGIQWGYERGIPTVYKECGTPTEWSADKEKHIRQAACVIAKAEAARQALRKLSDYEGDIIIIPNAFDPTLLSVEPVSPIPNPWTITHHIRLISIGRLSSEKGVQFLPYIVEEVLDRGVQVELLIIGSGSLEDELERTCEALNISTHVRFLGVLNHAEVLRLLQGADIFLLPSLTEGLPNVVLEAMACGVAVVATTAGGTPDLIENGVTGILTPPGEPAAMAEAIIKLSQDRTLLETLGSAGQEAFLSGPWTPEALGSHTLEVYQHAITTAMKRQAQVVQ